MSTKHTPGPLHREVEHSLDYLRKNIGGQVRITGADGADYIITARRWMSARRQENPTQFFLDGDRASVETIIGVIAYGCDALLGGGRLILREPTLRAAIAKATGSAS